MLAANMQDIPSQHPDCFQENANVNAASARTYDPQVKGSSIENLWVLLVPEGDGQGKTPMLASAGGGLYLLAFRTGFTARKFMTDSGNTAAEPRMVVGSISSDILARLGSKNVAGVLVDYDFTTNAYREASLMF
jgi:hypothetical protein